MSQIKFSKKWAARLGETHHLNEDKQAEIAYAIEILMLNLVNTILTLTLGWLMGVFWGTLTCLLTIAAFRHNAGGGHSESPWRCAMVTMIVFPLLALVSRYIATWQLCYCDLLSLLSVLAGFTFIFIYAPVEDPKAPIVSPQRRKKLKNLALVVMTILSLIIICLRFTHGYNTSTIQMCLVLSILWVSFNLTPIGRKLWFFLDNI